MNFAQRYHPIRAERVDKLSAVREGKVKGDLQRQMLEVLKSKKMSTSDMAKDTSYRTEQRKKEGFDEDGQAEWRQLISKDINASRDYFQEQGRNIYDMTLLSPMFVNVDVDDLVVEDTPLPFRAIYMHFGVGAALSFADGLWIEGAYVRESEVIAEKLVFVFVCNHPDAEIVDAVPLGETYKRVTTAIAVSIDRNRDIASSISDAGVSGDPSVIACRHVVTSAIRMAVNGLLYLNLPRADIEFAYDRAAPEALVASVKSESKSKVDKAKRRLAQDGYIQVNFCGRNTVAVAGQSTPSGEGRAGRTPHWRRGHWRRVVVGVGRQGREWRLFEATIVNQSSGPPVVGRIHIVQQNLNEIGRHRSGKSKQ
jgi:hypothetical protein